MTRAPTVYLIDDDASLRGALEKLLRASGYEVRAYPSAGEFLLEDLPTLRGCLLLDLQLPGPSGLDLQDALSRRGNRLPIVFMSAHGDIPASVRAMRGGATDFLTKPVGRADLLAALSAALARHDAETGDAMHRAELLRRYGSLTPRERGVFAGVAAGKLNKQIAGDLGTVEQTIKVHRARVMEKMKVQSLAELVRVFESARAAGL